MTTPDAPILYKIVTTPVHCKLPETNQGRPNCSNDRHNCPIYSGLRELGDAHSLQRKTLTEEKIRCAFVEKSVEIELIQNAIIVSCRRDNTSTGGVLFQRIPLRKQRS